MKNILYEPMDDGDIKYYLPTLNIIKYNQLVNYSNIDELLVKPKDYCLILYEWTSNVGHWIALLKYKNIIEYFDPYGKPINHWIKKDKPLGQNPSDLMNLLTPPAPGSASGRARVGPNSKYTTIYNKVEYQNLKNESLATCGAHCLSRMKCLEYFDLNCDDYYYLLNYIKNTEGLSYDKIVVSLFNKR
jgi:hypothetical protein